jgi:diguanylate cyclase (GGDEF)-like protein/PAS domain S-box-containing protein
MAVKPKSSIKPKTPNKHKTAVKPEAVSKTEKKKNKQDDLSHLAKAIISNAGVGIYIVQHGKFVYVSQLYQKIAGYKDTELIGTYSLGNIYPDDREMVREEAIKCLKGKSIEPYEYRFIKKNDEVMWALETITPIVYKGERATLGSFMDITGRKKMEETLRQNEERYRTILDEMADAYFEVDVTGNYTFVNDAVCRHLGYSKEELIGTSFRDQMSKEELDKVYKAFGKIYMTGKPERGIFYKLLRKDGTTGFAEMTGFPLKNQQGEVIGFRGVGRDITERRQIEEALRQSEEKHRNIIESIEDGYYEVDLAGNFTFFNDSTCEIYGYSREELMGMSHRQIADKENSKKVFEAFNEIYRTGIAGSIFDYEIIRKDGTRRQIEISASLKKDSSGNPIGFSGTIRDATERKKMEEALRQSEERYRTILDEMEDAYFEVDIAGNYTFVNDSCCRHLGYSKEELIGTSFRGQMAKEEFKKVYQAFGNIYTTIKPQRGILYKLLRKDGTTGFAEMTGFPLQNQKGEVIGFRGVGRDITERKRMEEALRDSEKRFRELSIIDELTQLYNSRHFYFQLQIELDRSNRYGQPLTLFLLDLDNFKALNDTYGHVEGDQVLRRLGQVLKRCMRKTDLAYRYGGEEFTILLPMTTCADSTVIAERIRAELKKESFSPKAGKDVHMTVSIGAAQFKLQEDMKDFVNRVDQLMYQAKKNGKDRVCSES